MASFEIDDDFFTKDIDELSTILASRSGTLPGRLVFSEPKVDLHTMVHALTPRELLDAVNVIVDEERFSVKINTFTQYLELSHRHGMALIETATPQFAWDENSATEDLLVTFTFKDIIFNDPKRLNKLNHHYPTIQLSCSENGVVYMRSFQTMKGGRTVENLLWTIIHFFHDVDRLYHDIVTFTPGTN